MIQVKEQQMFKINDLSVKPNIDSIISRQVELIGDSYRAEFGFIPYSKHPMVVGGGIPVPKFDELRYDDRINARRAFSSVYQKYEFANFCSKTGSEPFYECINILTEKGVWWGMLINPDGSKPRNPKVIIEASSQVVKDCEPDHMRNNPFCVIYSGTGLSPTSKKDFDRARIIGEEFGGLENVPSDHPYFKNNLKIMCVAQAMAGSEPIIVIASISHNEVKKLTEKIKDTFGSNKVDSVPVSTNDLLASFTPASSFKLDILDKSHPSWDTIPHIEFNRLAILGMGE
jgi:hypothetical protein